MKVKRDYSLFANGDIIQGCNIELENVDTNIDVLKEVYKAFDDYCVPIIITKLFGGEALIIQRPTDWENIRDKYYEELKKI